MDILDIILSFLALIVLEIILGIDNLVFLSILTEKLKKDDRQRARRWGLACAWVTRLLLLASAVLLVKLTTPIVFILGYSLSMRDLFLMIGGAFLIAKATQEIHNEVADDPETTEVLKSSPPTFIGVVAQVGLMDVIFSLDSVLTAIGLTNQFWVMALAITGAIWVMVYASDPVSAYIDKHPTIKMLALSFLMLIGTVLIADSLSFHIPRGTIYFAMGFSLSVECLNVLKRSRLKRRKRR
jgi:predicted tellurium resistance membrane protein TerC